MHINPQESEVFKFPAKDRLNRLRIEIADAKNELAALQRKIGDLNTALNLKEIEFKQLLSSME